MTWSEQTNASFAFHEGPYVVLRDAIMRNASFGDEHGLELDSKATFGIILILRTRLTWASSLKIFRTLHSRRSLSGKTWSDRVNATVHLDGSNIAHLRTEVRVEATTSTESKRVVAEFESMIGSTDEDGTLVPL